MYSEQNRAISYAVLASTVLHGALLFGVSQRSRPPLAQAELRPLVARLVEPPAPVAALPQPPQPPRSEPEKPKPRPRAAPAPRPVAKAPAPVAQPMREPPAEKAAPEERSEAMVTPPVTPVPEVARADPAPAAPAMPRSSQMAEPTPAAESLAQYRQQLLGAARKFKRYPRLAMENNWEGDVVVRMAFGGNGLLAGLSIQTSSGYAVLDQQALEMFKQAAKRVDVPPALRGREFSFEVRAIYNLRDQDSG